jgi:hypothetical protein
MHANQRLIFRSHQSKVLDHVIWNFWSQHANKQTTQVVAHVIWILSPTWGTMQPDWWVLLQKAPPHCNDEETWAMFISFLSFMQNPIPLCVCVCVCVCVREREREREHLLSYNRIHTAFCFLTIRCFSIKDMWLN